MIHDFATEWLWQRHSIELSELSVDATGTTYTFPFPVVFGWSPSSEDCEVNVPFLVSTYLAKSLNISSFEEDRDNPLVLFSDDPCPTVLTSAVSFDNSSILDDAVVRIEAWPGKLWIEFIIIRLGLNVALTHYNRSYLDSETKENVEAQTRKQTGRNDRKRTATTKNKHN